MRLIRPDLLSRQFPLLMTLTLVAAACSTDDQDDDSGGSRAIEAPFLNPMSLTGETYTDLKSDGIRDNAEKIDTALYLNEPDDDEDDDGNGDTGGQDSAQSEGDQCIQNAMDGLPVRAAGRTISIGIDMDLAKACPKAFSADGGDVALKSFTIRMYAEYTCATTDLSQWNGKPLSELGDQATQLCQPGEGHSVLHNLQTDLTLEMMGATFTARSATAETAADGGPCVHQPAYGGYEVADCRTVTLSTDKNTAGGTEGFTIEAKEETILLTAVFKNLTYGSEQDAFYRSGQVALNLNGWTGTAEYRGVDTAPEWMLAKGDVAVSGTVGKTPADVAGLAYGLIAASLPSGGDKPRAGIKVGNPFKTAP